MNGNPHYAAAEDHLNSENMTSGTEFAKEYRELVQIEATLALAYEQRTANMIALYAADEACAQGINLATGWDIDNWASLAKTITSRLGLDTK